MVKSILSVMVIGALFCSVAGWAQDQSMPQGTPAPDDTKVNQRDRDGAEPTADQQKENRSDRELTRQVRRALVQDKSLSTYSHNVKIIAQNGTVTLKGPVKSEEEKMAIEQKAAQIAGGAEKIHSELEVKDETGSKPSDNQ